MSRAAASSARFRDRSRNPIAVIGLAVLLAGCVGPAPRGSSATESAVATTGPVSTASAVAATTTRPASPIPSVPAAVATGDPISRGDLRGGIAFAYDDGDWVSDASGGHRRQLTHDGGFDPTFSPDGSRIAYRLLLAADDGEIWVMDAAGGHRHDPVNDPDFSDWGPAWSPDGREIAYDSNRRVGLAIWLMQVDGSNQCIITDGHGEYPSWSPDGKRIAYSGGDYYDIHVVDVDGSNDVAITISLAYDMGPAWSPDRQWIAYHTQADYYPSLGESGMGPEMEIHLIRPDGSGDHRITVDQVEDSFAAWSPDGRFLMWSRHGELVVARTDGSGMIDIGPGNFPSWIPWGRRAHDSYLVNLRAPAGSRAPGLGRRR
jgi:TolB protein